MGYPAKRPYEVSLWHMKGNGVSIMLQSLWKTCFADNYCNVSGNSDAHSSNKNKMIIKCILHHVNLKANSIPEALRTYKVH